MLWYIKEMKAINAAEDSSHTLHNTYSLRGAKIREPLPWSKFLNQAIDLWGDEAEVMFGMHHWPVWGNDKINTHLKSQRDLYRFINDETLRLANQGYTMVEIAERIKLPKSLGTNWSNRGYYGSMNHNIKATYVLYLGWFIGNPATLHTLPPVESSKKYVEYMGGAGEVLKRAKKAFDKGEYRWVAQVVNHVVFADPGNQAAKNLQADTLEQLGYQAENGPWRNFYLSGAKELRQGVKQLPTPVTASPDTIRAMDLDLFFDYLAMKLNGPKADGKNITINVDFTDVNERYLLELSNSVLNHTAERHSEKADASVKMTRKTLNNIILGQTTLKKAADAGDVTVKGNKDSLKQLLSYIEGFDFWFNIVTP
jgi:alkyl sulfatase BDS1-like metallo-beta-lactamase superfamily hydrolase